MRLKNLAIYVLLLPVLCSCMSLFAPSFVKDEIKLGEEYKKKNPDSFHTIIGPKRDLYYTEIGKPHAPKIIFVHGSPGAWGAFVQLLNRDKLRQQAVMVSVDRLGYGGSARGGVSRSLEEQAKAVMQVLDLDDPDQPAIIVGHSYGGPVVAKMATLGDPRIRSVVILAGSVDPSLEDTKWYQYPADWLIFSWMIPKDLLTCNREIMALKPELDILANEWDKISARITVVQGLADNLVPPGNADFIEKKTQRLHPKIIRIPDRNHFLQAYENDRVEAILIEELALIGNK